MRSKIAVKQQVVPLYRVDMDSETGMWLSDPELIGTCRLNDLPADTDDIHYDSFDAETVECLREAGETRTCGIECHYVD